MTKYQVVYWRDIPAQVKARSGAERGARQLSPRFQEAIDAAAMIAGAAGTDDYLAAWRTAEWQSAEGPLSAVLEEVAARLEIEHPDERLEKLKLGGGKEIS
ncbi:MAG: hypothetical protein FJW39_10350 [Acidobacteria bacterium]|nr:hypothetical protein [Acidobacteriota bacterium]